MSNSRNADVDPLAGPALPPQFRWHCEPQRWSIGGGRLRIEPDAATDFWQRTHYGFRTDNGHFLYRQADGDFVLTVRVMFSPAHQYDQAGLMVRISADCWLKSSVEFEPSGPCRLGAVVTNQGYSDWSSQDFPPEVNEVWLRIRREADDYLVDASRDGGRWHPLRMAHLHGVSGLPVTCGIYACSPKDRGFVCEFTELSFQPTRLQTSTSPI
jgi:regulation of enolase protein 1 (concanavalin A-like superfamily)